MSALVLDTAALARFGFAPLTPAVCELRLEQLTNAALGTARLGQGDPGQDLLDAIAAAPSVVLVEPRLEGWLAFAAAAVATTTRARVVPLVLSGLELRPLSGGREDDLRRTTVTEAAIVIALDGETAAVATQLGAEAARVHRVGSDAWDVTDEATPEPLSSREAGAFVVVSDPELKHAAAHLPGVEVVALTAAEPTWLVTQAGLLITDDPAQAAFALSRGVPTVALAGDASAQGRLGGALGLVGLEGWVVSALGPDLLAAAVSEAWDRHDELHEHLTAASAVQAGRRAVAGQARAALDAGAPPPDADPAVVTALAPTGDWTASNAEALGWDRLAGARVEAAEQERDAARHEAARLAEQVTYLDSVITSQLDRQAVLLDNLEVERSAGESARWQNALLLEQSLELTRLTSSPLLRLVTRAQSWRARLGPRTPR